AAGVLAATRTVTLGAYFWVLAWVGAAVSLVMRYRKSGWEQRQRIKWFASAGPVLAAGIGLYVAAFDWDPISLRSPLLRDAGYVMLILGVVGLAAASGMAILTRRLLEIDLILRRSVVYVVLTALVVAAYLGIAAAVGVAAGGRLPVAVAVVVTAVAALAVQPVRRFLERVLEERLFGRRLSDEELLRRFGTSLQETGDPHQLLGRLAATARRGLDLRWARVSLHGGRTTTEGRPSGAPALVVPITHGEEELGAIECGPKAEGVLSDKDVELLATLAAQAALAARNARLAARIVQAQDAERRRIERNIHDGVQQQLAALVANLGQARERLRREGAISEGFLAELQAAAVAILGELQELARGIYPSVLTDGGLAAAVADRCAGLPIALTMEVDPALLEQRFPTDIEGAGYFVAMEALANTLKHAEARSVAVRLGVSDGKVTVEVSDDGVGFDTAAIRHGGLANLADRIAALAGVLRIDSRAGGGTRVRAELPVREGGRSGG
ncbi:MAG: histidine kinase, partial [Actinomycetota bacterium]|nr:histidine kinase [Actinomycetota bacterium]